MNLLMKQKDTENKFMVTKGERGVGGGAVDKLAGWDQQIHTHMKYYYI